MGWRAEYVASGGFVETRYEGVLGADELAAAVQQTLAVARAHGTTLYLGDCSKLVGGHTIFDLYGFVRLLESLGLVGRFKEALIMPALSAAARDVVFWETACQNRGLLVKVFPDREAALQWLCSPPQFMFPEPPPAT